MGCDLNNKGWNSEWDDFFEVPYSYKGDQWIGYDNKDSIELKVEYALEKNLGGIMFWSMDLDDFTGSHCNEGEYPLVRTARSSLGYTDNLKTTVTPTTVPLTTEPVTTEAPTTEAPTTEAPTTLLLTTEPVTTEAPTTEAPTTLL